MHDLCSNSKQTRLIKCHTDISNNDCPVQIPLVNYTCQEKSYRGSIKQTGNYLPPRQSMDLSVCVVPGSSEN